MVSKFTGEHQKIKSIRSRPRERLTVVKVLSMERLQLRKKPGTRNPRLNYFYTQKNRGTKMIPRRMLITYLQISEVIIKIM